MTHFYHCMQGEEGRFAAAHFPPLPAAALEAAFAEAPASAVPPHAAGSALPVLAAFYALVRDHAAAATAAPSSGHHSGEPVAWLGRGVAAAAPLAQLTAAMHGSRGSYEAIQSRRVARARA